MEFIAINSRYSELADKNCCLSCGGAINYAKPQKGEICVDLGSGRGTDVLTMADQVGEDGFVYGIDISDGMLEKAKKTAARLDIENVIFIQSDLSQIDLHTDTADLIISNCTINHASDKKGVWDEVFRILKKGGRFVVSDIYAINPIPDIYRNDPEAVAECWAGAVTKEEYLEVIQRSGFKNVEILEESNPYIKGKAEVASFTIKGIKPIE